MQDFISSVLATLLVIIDPIFTSAIFLGITQGMSKPQRNEVALRGSAIAFFILLGAGLGGAKLLLLLGISLAALRIAGGLLLLSSAGEMVFDWRSQRRESLAEKAITIDHVRNVAAFPLAIPLLAGPGAITAMILLSGRAGLDVPKQVALYALTAFVLLLCYLCFRAADRIAFLLGVTGRALISRILGIILAALAVQFIIDGIKVLFG